MVGAGLMLQTVARLRAIDIGFRPDRLLTLRTTLPRAKYQDPVKRIGFYHRVLEGVRGLPGVQNAAYSSDRRSARRGIRRAFASRAASARRAIRAMRCCGCRAATTSRHSASGSRKGG